MTKITFVMGSTAREVGKKKDTRVYGGETLDIVPDQADAALREEIAVKPGSKEAKAFLAANKVNPRTRRQNLEAKSPGLDLKLAGKRALADFVSGRRSKSDLLGEKLNGPKTKADGVD